MARVVADNTCIGRVGALAVALGIGSAILGMPGVAWADTDGTGSNGTSQTSAGPSAASAGSTAGKARTDKLGNVTNRPAKDRPAKDRPAKDRSAKDRSTAGEDAAAADPSGKSDAAPKTKRPRPVTKAIANHDDTGVEGAADRSSTDTAGSASAVRENDGAAPDHVTGAPRPLATALRASFAPRALTPSDDAPEAPAASPLLWTMLAYARRGQLSFHAATDTTASTAAPAAAVQAAGVHIVPGNAYSSPIVAADGTIYQVTTGIDSLRVFVLDRDAQVIASSGQIAGYLRGGAVTRPDGTLVVITANQRGSRSAVSTIDSAGSVTTIARVTGEPDFRLRTGADGALHFSTDVPNPFSPFGGTLPNRYYRISPSNVVQALPYDTSLTLAADGSAYLVSRQLGSATLRVFTPTGNRTIPLPFGSTVSNPIVGQDGTVYVTAGQRGLFGTKTTRVYALVGTTSTVSTVIGSPGATVATADGLYLETFTFSGNTDPGTGTTYISRITTAGTQTSDPIAGRVAGFSFQVTPNGTVYVPITDPSSSNGQVAVVSAAGAVTTVTLPGTLVNRTIRTDDAGTAGSANVGYVGYSAGGTDHVAVVNPDGSVVRTIDLPAGATASTTFFGPDGAAYQLLDYFGPDQGQTTARQLLALDTGTLTQVVPGTGAPGSFDVVFGPDGVGYFLTGTANSTITKIIGVDGTGATVIPLSTFIQPVSALVDNGDYPADQYLSFAPDGTAYILDYTVEPSAGVYALTSAGPQLVQVVNRAGGVRATAPTFTADGTIGFVTIAANTGGTVVLSFPTLTTL